MIPVIDMVNHSSEGERRNASLQLQQPSGAGSSGLQDASFQLVTGQASAGLGSLS